MDSKRKNRLLLNILVFSLLLPISVVAKDESSIRKPSGILDAFSKFKSGEFICIKSTPGTSGSGTNYTMYQLARQQDFDSSAEINQVEYSTLGGTNLMQKTLTMFDMCDSHGPVTVIGQDAKGVPAICCIKK